MPVVGAIDSVFIPRILTQLRPPPFPIIGSVAERAQAVVIGGGITGASVAYHLAKAGLKDTLLLDKGELTSGSTCHAAGLVTQFNPSPTMMRFRRYSVELYRELGVFDQLGSLRIASSRESLVELQRGASRARGLGLDVHLVSPDEAVELMPAASPDGLFGAIAVAAVDGHQLPRDMPCFRDTDNLVYGRSEAGGVLFGGYEPNPVSRWLDGVPWEHAAANLPADEGRFAQLWAGAARRFPFLEDAGMVTLECHPDAMTPDGNPLLGPLPGVPGFWMAAGLSLNGFGGAGGIGKTIAEWMTDGEAELDTLGMRAWRFGDAYRSPAQVDAAGRAVYRYYYRLRYPLDTDELGRPNRLSPLHGRLQEAGAAFGVKNGWERADHFEPGTPWRRSGADQREFGWTRPPWFRQVAEEHKAIRERVGLIDMTSFGKIEVQGPGALPLLERVACNLIDRPLGSVVYTQLLNRGGGIVADVTVTRLGDDRFRVVTGAGVVDSDLGWLRANIEPDDGPVALRDASTELAVIGMWGPAARDVLEGATDDDVSAEAFPFRTALALRVAGTDVTAQRITYVGELGFELYLAP